MTNRNSTARLQINLAPIAAGHAHNYTDEILDPALESLTPLLMGTTSCRTEDNVYFSDLQNTEHIKITSINDLRSSVM